MRTQLSELARIDNVTDTRVRSIESGVAASGYNLYYRGHLTGGERGILGFGATDRYLHIIQDICLKTLAGKGHLIPGPRLDRTKTIASIFICYCGLFLTCLCVGQGDRCPWLDRTALIGDEATVLDRIAELRAGGVDELAAYPLGGSAEIRDRTRAFLRTCL